MHSLQAALRRRIEPFLDAEQTDSVLRALAPFAAAAQKEVVDLGLLLSDVSSKSASEYFRQLPRCLPALTEAEVASVLPPWVGVGIRVAQASGSAGIKYFRESAGFLTPLAHAPRAAELWSALHTVVDQAPALPLEVFRGGIVLLEGTDPLDRWSALALALAKEEYTLSVEYLRISPELLRWLPMEAMPRWIEVGLKLAEPPRYFDSVVFYRLSPELFAQIPKELCSKFLHIIARLAEDKPAIVLPFFKEAPELLSVIRRADPSGALPEASLEVALQIAAYDGEMAATFLRKTPEVLKTLGGRSHRYIDWVAGGLSLLSGDRDRAKGYFTLQTREGREAMDRLVGGVSLLSVQGILKRLTTAFGGRALAIRPLGEGESGEGIPALPRSDGLVLYLPSHVRISSEDQDNFRWYKAAVAHASGRLAFGSYALSEERLRKVLQWLSARHKMTVEAQDPGGLWSRFPRPLLARDLFDLAEGARIDAQLRRNYPGLAKELDQIAALTVVRRMPISGKSPEEAAVELLLQISLTGRTREPIPNALQPVLAEACRILAVVQEPEATVETSMRAACESYWIIDPKGPTGPSPEGPMERLEGSDRGERGQGEGSGQYRPADPVSHRGELDPQSARRTKKLIEEQAASFIQKLKEAGADLGLQEAAGKVEEAYRSGELDPDRLEDSSAFSDWAERTLESARHRDREDREELEPTVLYPEWDCATGDYREEWCRLLERKIVPEEKGEAFYRQVCRERYGERAEIVRLFQSLRPGGFGKIRGEEEGEEIDLDIAIMEHADRRAGYFTRTRAYRRRQRRERSVAAVVLVDLSGSTAQQVLPGRSVLTIEKEGLVLLAEALGAIGDPTAVYGFSGRGRNQAVFYTLKAFEEGWDPFRRRLAGLEGSHQNRDGVAIRHASSKLARRPENIKLMILISDGKPLDEGYEGAYALQDTRKALQEAKAVGIHPFCITVDREGPDYLEGMYGEVAFTVIDDPASLPRRLPRIYRRLTT